MRVSCLKLLCIFLVAFLILTTLAEGKKTKKGKSPKQKYRGREPWRQPRSNEQNDGVKADPHVNETAVDKKDNSTKEHGRGDDNDHSHHSVQLGSRPIYIHVKGDVTSHRASCHHGYRGHRDHSAHHGHSKSLKGSSKSRSSTSRSKRGSRKSRHDHSRRHGYDRSAGHRSMKKSHRSRRHTGKRHGSKRSRGHSHSMSSSKGSHDRSHSKSSRKGSRYDHSRKGSGSGSSHSDHSHKKSHHSRYGHDNTRKSFRHSGSGHRHGKDRSHRSHGHGSHGHMGHVGRSHGSHSHMGDGSRSHGSHSHMGHGSRSHGSHSHMGHGSRSHGSHGHMGQGSRSHGSHSHMGHGSRSHGSHGHMRHMRRMRHGRRSCGSKRSHGSWDASPETHVYIHVKVAEKHRRDRSDKDHSKDEFKYYRCDFRSNDPDGHVSGNVILRQKPWSRTLEVKVNVSGVDPPADAQPDSHSLHGLHVHEFGDFSNGCLSFGGHFNPEGEDHAGPHNETRHVGDWGNLEVDSHGNAQTYMNFTDTPMFGPKSLVGRGIVLHAGQDDLGQGGTESSLATGNAGGRLACCIIGRTKALADEDW